MKWAENSVETTIEDAPNNAPVVQRRERSFPKRKVTGSNPVRSTNIMNLVTIRSLSPTQPKVASFPELSRELEKTLLLSLDMALSKHKVKKVTLNTTEILVKNGKITDYIVKDDILIGKGKLDNGRDVIGMLISVEKI